VLVFIKVFDKNNLVVAFMKFLLAFLFSFAIAYFVMPAFINFAIKNDFVDKPTKRKKHMKSVPLVGGIVMYISFIIVFLFFIDLKNIKHVAILLGSFLIITIGIIDDYYKSKSREFGAAPRAIIQILSAIILYLSGIKFTGFMNPITETYILFPHVLQFILTVLWIFGVTTVINFSDGLDGLAGGFSCISAATLFVVAMYKEQTISAMMSIILVGSILGFLRYNFHPAKVFMGDSGATFLGYMLAVISLYGAFKQATVISVFIPVLTLGIPIFDNLFVVLKRFLQHEPVYKADFNQIHYRLLNSGMNDKQVVRYLFILNMCFNLASIIILLLKI
jgi:UDP-N-acetylmuramyl pentapeptide phosphotransferase/UDP-N-acetylglucosamine-1-phosphate transferase